ncbi:MAG: hypothetical protein IJZ19_08540, partial [Lentisphaeria bacterium]|nr:hypothetical protein [Lentisphaeria bacterium]
RLYFRRHFKAATNVPPLDHVRVAPAGEYALRAEFYLKLRRLESPARGDSRPLPRPTFGRCARIFFISLCLVHSHRKRLLLFLFQDLATAFFGILLTEISGRSIR